MRVAIVTTAGPSVGRGHLIRCAALATALQRCGAEVEFACGSIDASSRSLLASGGLTLLDDAKPLGQALDRVDDLPERLERAANADGAWDWVVIDDYAIDESLERRIESVTSARLAIIDDGGSRRHDCDLLVNQNAGAASNWDYQGRLPTRARCLLGPKFALLRSEFERLASSQSTVAKNDHVVVTMGGGDSQGLTLRILSCLAAADRAAKLDVVVGSSDPGLPEIEDQCSRRPAWRLHVDSSEMATLLSSSAVVIGAGGVTALECCSVGAPSVLVSFAANQMAGCEALARARAAIYLGNADGDWSGSILRVVHHLLGRSSLRARIGNRGRSLVDGLGALRVALVMAKEGIRVRRAAPDDATLAWTWRNDPSTRRFVFDPAPIPLAHHLQWWHSSLANQDRALLMAEAGSVPVGVLRYDRLSEEEALVSVYLRPEMAGLGLGTEVIKAGTIWMKEDGSEMRVHRILAEILPQNIGSWRAFEAAGYNRVGDRNLWVQLIGD